jgi:hypothetical protein
MFKNLKDFIYSFDFIKLQRDPNLIAGGVPEGAYARGMSEQGKQYVFYIHHSLIKKNMMYVVQTGSYQENVVLNIEAGKYKADWVEPATGKVVNTVNFSHQGGERKFTTPQYTIDMALRIKETA